MKEFQYAFLSDPACFREGCVKPHSYHAHFRSDQEAAAGSSFRLALLAAELADWAAGNTGDSPSAEAELLSYLRGLDNTERTVLIRHLTLLCDFCASLTPRQYRELLGDAGMDAVSSIPEIGSLVGLLRGIAHAAASMSIQNQPEKVNIHRGVRCRPEKSLL